jgi:hypothetical protein
MRLLPELRGMIDDHIDDAATADVTSNSGEEFSLIDGVVGEADAHGFATSLIRAVLAATNMRVQGAGFMVVGAGSVARAATSVLGSLGADLESNDPAFALATNADLYTPLPTGAILVHSSPAIASRLVHQHGTNARPRPALIEVRSDDRMLLVVDPATYRIPLVTRRNLAAALARMVA